MAWWKKALICFGIAVVLFGAGFGTAVAVYRADNNDLRERIEYITNQYNEAKDTERELVDTIERLKRLNSEATIAIERLESQLRELRDRSAKLETTIEQLAAGISGSSGTISEADRILQETLRLLLAISKRGGKDN